MASLIVYYLILLSAVFLVDIASQFGGIETCKQSGEILYCNYSAPVNIQPGVTKVFIDNMNNTTDKEVLHIAPALFSGENWNNVTLLSINTEVHAIVVSYAFENLESLFHLGLHGEYLYTIEEDAFAGLGNLNSLDLSGCTRLSQEYLIGALNGSDTLARLSILNLTYLAFFIEGEVRMDAHFFQAIGGKNLSILSMRHMFISQLNMTSLQNNLCDTVVFLDFSFCHFGPFHADRNVTCKSLKRFDYNDVTSSDLIPPIIPPNIQVQVNVKDYFFFNFLTTINEISADNFVEHQTVPSMHNITFESISNVTFYTKNLSLARNKIAYLDVHFKNFNFKFEQIDFSSNAMEFIQPKIFTERNALKIINLSNNNLFKMAENNFTLFGRLFKYFSKLENIYLANNQLLTMPKSIFSFNKRLRSIDLSINLLEQIDFDLTGCPLLETLNLRNNRIVLLSETSIGILQRHIDEQISFRFDLRNNNLLCNKCECKPFIQWILDEHDSVLTDQTCVNDKGNSVKIDKTIVTDLDHICKRTSHLIITATVTVLCAIILTTSIACIVSCKTKMNKKSTVRERLDKFRNGSHKYGYITFIAFSGDDGDFVEQYVTRPLRENFCRLIGSNRDLVCTGDRHFRLGYSIAEEMDRCCKQAGVVLLVVSKTFCKSNYCINETHIAYTLRKPIIVMFKERVESTDMPPLLRTIFEQYTRVTWKRQGNEYVMSTSWKNVCESIFNVMDT